MTIQQMIVYLQHELLQARADKNTAYADNLRRRIVHLQSIA